MKIHQDSLKEVYAGEHFLQSMLPVRTNPLKDRKKKKFRHDSETKSQKPQSQHAGKYNCYGNVNV